MKLLIVGGSGRSGTSAIAERLRVVPEISSFLDVELRLLSEADGITDLYWNLVEAYSPQRAALALERFAIMFNALLQDAPGAVGLGHYISPEQWQNILSQFSSKILVADGVPRRLESAEYFEIVAQLVRDIASVNREFTAETQSRAIFLEKTPHNLLRIRLLSRIPIRSYYLHVVRDPRTVARSLLNMRWGPSSLPAAAAWVSAYFDEFFRTYEWTQRAGIQVRNIHIEAVATAPRVIARELFDDLDIVGNDKIFDDIGGGELNKTNAAISADEITELNASLAGLACRLGYSATTLGELTYDPFATSTVRNLV